MNIGSWIAIAVCIVLAAAPITGGGSKVNEKHLAKLARRQGLPLELAWDDALRAMAVRDLQESVVVSGVLATFGLVAMAGTWVSSPEVRAVAESLTDILGIFALATGVICSILLLVPMLIGRVHRNPSLRLWSCTRFRAA